MQNCLNHKFFTIRSKAVDMPWWHWSCLGSVKVSRQTGHWICSSSLLEAFFSQKVSYRAIDSCVHKGLPSSISEKCDGDGADYFVGGL